MKIRSFLEVIALIAIIPFSGCDCEADIARDKAWGRDHRITLYSGGKAVREWKSSGKVLPEKESDGWYFRDSKSGSLVRVSGTAVVEVIVDGEGAKP